MRYQTLSNYNLYQTRNVQMKPKLLALTLIGLLGSSLPSLAQNNAPTAAEQATPGAAVVTTTNEPAPGVEQPAPGGVTTPGGTAQPGAIIPIIVMDEAKLTDAIRNLARMA